MSNTVSHYLNVNQDLLKYINESIIPIYSGFDPAHQIEHALSVIDSALKMSRYYNVNQDMILTAAACHDIGLLDNRETHHLVSGVMIRNNNDLRKWFDEEQIETIAQAAEDHRASLDYEPRTIYGKIIAEADRQIIPETVIKRTVQFSIKNYPDLDRQGHWERTLSHLKEKYAEGGYLKLWIPESTNAQNLEILRKTIKDEAKLRLLFENFYKILGNER